jgi:hypothetical protein
MPSSDEVPAAEDQRPTLRFTIDALREAGASLGTIKSTVTRPKTYFRGLIKRLNQLQKQFDRHPGA